MTKRTKIAKELKQEVLVKALDTELRQVTYVAMLPDSVDAHGDFVSEEEVRKAKESFNVALHSKKHLANLFHVTSTDTYEVIESYIAPCDMELGGVDITKGTWLMTLQVHDEELWSMIKNEDIVGLSIGAVANVEVIDE